MKCLVCNKKADGRITIDLDVDGLGYCKSHKEDVRELVVWMMLAPEMYKKMLNLKIKLNESENNKSSNKKKHERRSKKK